MRASRRNFLLSGAAAATAALLPSIARTAPTSSGGLGIAIGGVSRKNKKSLLVLADLANRKFQTTEIDFHCHSVTAISNSESLALGVERLGHSAVLFDIRNGKISRIIQAPADRAFYGHAAYIENGHFAYVTTVAVAGAAPLASDVSYKAPAFVSKIDLTIGKIVSESQALGFYPHDIKLHPDGKKLIVPIGLRPTGKSELVYVDLDSMKETGALVSAFSKGSMAHVALAADGSFTSTVNTLKGGLVCAGALQVRNSDGVSLSSLELPGEIESLRESQLLSICYSADGQTLAATCPAHDQIFFFNIPERRLISSIKLKWPTGVSLALDGKHFVVAGLDGFTFVDTKTRKINARLGWRIPVVDQDVVEFYRHLDVALRN